MEKFKKYSTIIVFALLLFLVKVTGLKTGLHYFVKVLAPAHFSAIVSRY